jgi:WD40 repeat protein
MTTHARVEAIFAQVVDLPASERASTVRRLASGDASVEREVLDLLACLEDDAFLDPERFAREQSGLMLEGMLPVASRVAQYTVLGVLGAGGMGTVYLAEQARPRRQVALKVISGPVARETMIARFEREAELLGRLSHPGIAQIFEAGVADYGIGPRPFIAMERIEGDPISRYAKQRSLSARECASLVADVADAVEHAHLRGVIHRDIKPGNVLVDESGRPKVVDFGVARAIDEEFGGEATSPGGMLGTLSYMAPEQLRDARSVDSRADIYAIGVLLFELLTGQQPHDCRTGALTDVIRRVCDEPAPRIGDLERSLKGELEAIVACALEKDPDRRYRSAADFADDLRRWLRGEPIAARRDSLLDALGRRAKRHRRIVVAGGVILALAIVGGAWAATQAARNSRLAMSERDARERAVLSLELAQRERARADLEAARLRDRLYSSKIGFAQAALATGDTGRVQRLLSECPEDQRGWEWRHLASFANQADRTLQVNIEGMGYAAVDPVRDRVAAARFGEPARLFTLSTGESVATLPVEGGAFRLAFSPLDGSLTLANASGRLERWRSGADASRVTRTEGPTGGYRAIAPAPSSADLIVASGETPIERVDENGRTIWAHSGFDGAIVATGERSDVVLAGGVLGGTVAIRAADGAPVWAIDAPDDEVRGAAISPDGRHGAVVSRVGEVLVLDLRDGAIVWRASVGVSRAMAVMFTDDNTRVCVGATDGSITVVNRDTGEVEGRLRGHIGSVNTLAPIGDDRFVSYSRDGSLRWWSASRRLPDAEHIDLRAPGGLSGVASLGESFLATAFGGVIYRIDPAETSARWADRSAVVWRIDASPVGGMIAASRADGTVALLHDPDDPSDATVVRVSDHRVSKSSFSPSGTHLAAVDDGGVMSIIDTATSSIVARRLVHEGGAIGVRWAADGDSIWTTGNDGALRRWAVSATGAIDPSAPLDEMTLSTMPLWEIACSTDGAWVGVCGEDGVVRVVDVATRTVREFIGHVGPAFGIAFHPNEPRLASAGIDGRVRIWDVRSGEELLQLGPGGPSLTGVAFDERGERLGVSGADGVMRIWTAPLLVGAGYGVDD